MNCLEGLMYYSLKLHEPSSAITTIMRLFKHHQSCLEQLRVSFDIKFQA